MKTTSKENSQHAGGNADVAEQRGFKGGERKSLKARRQHKKKFPHR
jgi:hypothetical protein